MDCSGWRVLLSADIDDEATPDERAAARAHLAVCPTCSSWLDAATAVTRAARIESVEEVPDLTEAILAAATPAAERRPRWAPVRHVTPVQVGLAVVAIAQLVIALPAMLWPEHATHLHREHGAWELALAIGFATAAWRPARAAGLVPLVAALVAGLVLTTGIDAAGGATAALSERGHVIPMVGLALLVAGARGVRTT